MDEPVEEYRDFKSLSKDEKLLEQLTEYPGYMKVLREIHDAMD